MYSTRKIGFSLSTLQGKFPCEGILWKNSTSWHKANTISLYKRRPLTMQIHNSILNTDYGGSLTYRIEKHIAHKYHFLDF